MNKRKNADLGFLLLCVLGGVVLGSIIAILSQLGGFNTDLFVAIILTIIAVILITLCLYPLITNFKNFLILKRGTQVEGTIAGVVDTIASPLYYRPGDDGTLAPIGDMACIPAMYVLRITYTAGEKTIEKDFPPTIERTAKQLLPYKMEAGASIPLLCLAQRPQWAIIAIPSLLEETLAAQKGAVKYGVIASLIVFAIYVVLLFHI